MCYAIPARLISVDAKNTQIGTIDYFGEKRKILIDIDDIKIGDYVYAQGGILIRKIPEKEAIEILEHWKDIFFELKKTDEALARINKNNLTPNALSVLQKVNLRKSLTKKEMLALLELDDPKELSVICEIANNIRMREHENSSCVHGIIEFSNYCNNNCYYCGIRCDNEITRYRMSIEEIINTAKNAVDQYGFKAIVLQSGEDLWYGDDELVKIVKEIKKMGVLIFISIGARSRDTYLKLYNSGARAVLMRFESSNKYIFETLRPGTTLDERISLIKYLKEIGYILATGFMVGLPQETNQDIINNILLSKYLAPDMYSFGPFIPTKGTPLYNSNMISKDLILKVIAISRFIDSGSNILVTTALETLDNTAKKEALLSGANSMMINITPIKYRQLYKIYDKRAGLDKEVTQNIKEAIELLYNLGRAPTDICKNI